MLDTKKEREYYLDIAKSDEKGAFLDEHHSHFILVNDSVAAFGTVHSPSKARGLWKRCYGGRCMLDSGIVPWTVCCSGFGEKAPTITMP